ncbi:conserved hypothetical protein [Candidatus Sulfopaludibacter sp. SbA6]|nr:conserved hypothetical protein [Candidatus Sulfopaludibacter sp. SbA6]
MISGKLVHLIESNWDEVASRVIGQIRREPQMTHVRGLAESELHEWGQVLLENLGHWLSAGNEEDLAEKYEHLGKLRCEQDVPLHESVRCLCIVREKMLDFVEERILSKDVMELYAEEELERRLGRFFDVLTVHLVKGYERALRRAAMAMRA